MAGRPTKLTPTMHKAIIKLVEQGNLYIDITRAVGINKDAIHDWHTRGQKEMDNTGLNPDKYTRKQLIELADLQGLDYKPRTTKNTLAKHLYPETPFTRFSRDLTQARGKAITYAMEQMRTAGKEDWRMWRYYLSVMAPERFSQRAIDDSVEAGRQDPDEVDLGGALERGKTNLRLVKGSKAS